MPVSSDSKVDSSVIIDRLWQPLKSGSKMYALLDAARDRQIYPELTKLNSSSYGSLFLGKSATDLAAVAPYLVQLDRRTNFTKMLFDPGWGKSWGIFLESAASLDDLQKHFQGLLLVKDEAGRPLHFRFYDPRVLRVYLPTCTDAELQTVLGTSVIRYCVESEDGTNLIEFPPKEGKRSSLQ